MTFRGKFGRRIVYLAVALLLIFPLTTAILDPLEYYTDHSKMEGSRGMYRIDTFLMGRDIVDIELLENSDYCFLDCEAKLKVHPYEDMKLDKKTLYLDFLDVKGRNNDLKDFSIEILTTDTVEKTREVCISYQNHTYSNETEGSNESYTVETCSEYGKERYTETISEYQEFDRNKIVLEAGNDYYIKFVGTKTRPINIDWIPTFMGHRLDKWAWWNSSYDYKRNITNDTSSYDIAMAINGTDGFGSNIIWFNPSQLDGDSYLYYDNTSFYAVANDTDEGNYETEGGGLNNSPTSVYSSNAKAIYHFGSSGDYDDSTGNYDATCTNCPDFTSSGVYEGAMDFEESNSDALLTGDLMGFSDGDNITITAWVNVESHQANGNILSNYDRNAIKGVYLSTFASIGGLTNTICITNQVSGSEHNRSCFDSNISTGWNFVVAEVTSGGTTRIWVNATEYTNEFSGGSGSSSSFSSRNWVIGAQAYNSGYANERFFDGKIDEVRIYDRLLTADEIEALYNNSQGLNNLLGSEEEVDSINLTRHAQTPSDVTSGNLFNQSLEVLYDLGIDGSLVLDTTKLFYKTNTTSSDVIYYLNGTAVEGYQEVSGIYNETIWSIYFTTTYRYKYVLDDNEIYPASYNLDPDTFRETTPSTISLLGRSNYYKTKFFNVSNETQYNEFEIMMLGDGTSISPVELFYCNSSYASGTVFSNSNCALVYDFINETSYDHCHSSSGGVNNSCHIIAPIAINTSAGTLEDVTVTPTSYFVVRGANSGTWNISYIDNITRSDQIQSSNNNGATWSNFAGTINAHIHQFTGDENLSYYAWANDTEGDNYTSSTYTESIELDPLPPGAILFYEPTLNDTFEDNLIINYSASISPQNDTIEYYNITYYYENYTFIDTIIGNNSNNLTYNWSLENISAGTYRIGVEAFDNNSLSTLIESQQFFIVKIAPSISIDFNESGINTSEANHTINYNVTDSASSSFNCTLNLNGDTSTQNATNNTLTYANISLVPGENWAYIACTDQGGTTGSTNETYLLNEFIDEDCSLGNVLYNFSFYDIETDASINADMESLFYIYNSSGDNVYNYSTEVTNESYYALCVLNYTSDYTISSFQEYSSEGYETSNYSSGTYYLNDASMEEENNISLYLLDEDEVTQVLFHTTDNVGVAYPDLYIKVQEFDIAAGSSRNIMILKTDDNGEALGNLNLYETWYTFIIEDEEGNVLKTTTPQQLNTNEYYFRINPSVVVLENYLDITGLSYTLTYSNSTNVTRFTLTDSTGLSNNICLKITELGLGGTEEIYSSCVESTSADITYTFGPTETNNYIATGYIMTEGEYDGVSIVIDTLEINRGDEVSPYGLTGVFIAIFILGTIMFAGLFNPIAPIIIGIVGMGLLAAVGILTVPVTALASIFMLGAILLYFLRR